MGAPIEDLLHYLMAFFEDNLLSANGGLTHHGDSTVTVYSTPSTMSTLCSLL